METGRKSSAHRATNLSIDPEIKKLGVALAKYRTDGSLTRLIEELILAESGVAHPKAAMKKAVEDAIAKIETSRGKSVDEKKKLKNISASAARVL